MPSTRNTFRYNFGSYSRNSRLINYTSRDYTSIRRNLVSYARRYYQDTLQDFTENSFGGLLIDSVAYVGDVLSFYLDYNVNEAFLSTASQDNNIIRLARNSGYKYPGRSSAFGIVSLYVIVPSNNSGTGPDSNYLGFTIKRGTRFRARGSGGSYILMNDVRFDRAYNDTVVARVDESTGVPTAFALKSYGRVVSGRMAVKVIQVGDYERFKRVSFRDPGMTEIISVYDSEGNEYFEVDYLSQNVIYREVTNPNVCNDDIPSVIKPITVPRRFTVERRRNFAILQFGYGSVAAARPNVADPTSVTMDIFGKDYTTDISFDPSRLLRTSKFGIAPANTALTIRYRTSNPVTANANSGKIRSIADLIMEWDDPTKINRTTMRQIRSSLEVFNEKPIVGDLRRVGTEEIRQRALDMFPTQNRAVTKLDYQAIVYGMNPKFGAIKRCAIFQDPDSLKRNLNLYVMSQNEEGFFALANDTLKRNLKVWLMQYKMLNDTIDILDGKIVNFGIRFKAKILPGRDRTRVMSSILTKLKLHFRPKQHFGEPVSIAAVYKLINTVPGVMDCLKVSIIAKTGSPYSTTRFNFDRNISADGTELVVPKNVILELKYPNVDIKGSVV